MCIFWWIQTRSFRWDHQNSKFPSQPKVMMKKLLKITEFATLPESVYFPKYPIYQSRILTAQIKDFNKYFIKILERFLWLLGNYTLFGNVAISVYTSSFLFHHNFWLKWTFWILMVLSEWSSFSLEKIYFSLTSNLFLNKIWL